MNFIKENVLYLVFGLSFISILGSYYFSEYMGWAPCSLCWYQRLFMLSLVIISLVGIFLRDTRVRSYIKPFAILGVVFAFFHNLLYWNIVPESAVPCANGISCVTDYLELFGFITIPLLSLVVFGLITSLVFLKNNNLEIKNENQ